MGMSDWRCLDFGLARTIELCSVRAGPLRSVCGLLRHQTYRPIAAIWHRGEPVVQLLLQTGLTIVWL